MDSMTLRSCWLARIAPVMRSLHLPGGVWLPKRLQGSMSIKCEAIKARTDYGPLARVEERASILLLQSLPADLQTEAVSVRGLASSALIFLVMSRYQPGGSSEKSMILSFLTQPHVVVKATS